MILSKILRSIFLRRPVAAFILILVSASISRAGQQEAEESDQQISDFSLSGFGDKGKKTWDIYGKTADIFTDIIKLKDIVGNLYGKNDKDDDIKLTARQGDFNKAEGKVHLEQDVVITTSSGARLLTDSLDWDRKNQVVATEDIVNIKKDNMVTVASGAKGHPNLNKMTLVKDVTTRIDAAPAEEKKEKQEKNETVITCDGPLEIDYEKNIATFNNNVKVDRGDLLIYGDAMDVYFSSGGKGAGSQDTADKGGLGISASKIKKIHCRGNVKIVRGGNVSYSDEAVYTASDKKITLIGNPKLILQSAEELGASVGN